MDITIYFTLENDILRFYFKTLDAQLFGGEGRTGYCSSEKEISENSSLSDIDILAHYAVQAASVADTLGIDRSQLVSITKEEYDASDEKE